MNKKTKIIIGIISIIIICLILYIISTLQIFSSSKDEETPQLSGNKIEILDDSGTSNLDIKNNDSSDFETDFMNDLEDYFNKGNGYEEIEGNYGFNNVDLE